MVKIVECPRDAMQGIHQFIPTQEKTAYLNQLLKAGFDVLDFGSFVSPKAIPQMQDTAQVLSKLELISHTKLLAIIANIRGAQDAAAHEEITYLGYPFSISETFQLRNTNRSIQDALNDLQVIADICDRSKKEPVVYISMGFGNPYGDPYSSEIVGEWAGKLASFGFRNISLADTTGTADLKAITPLFQHLISAYPEVEFSAHFHSRLEETLDKLEAAWEGGCRKFEGALFGYGGCPMAKDELVGNVDTRILVDFIKEKEDLKLNREAYEEAQRMAREFFSKYS